MNGQRHFTFPVVPRADYIPVVNPSAYTIYGDGSQAAYILPNYIDPTYGAQQQIAPANNSKKAYYYPKPNNKCSPKKDSNYMKHPFSNQVQLRPQVIQ